MIALNCSLALARGACTHERISDCTALAIVGVFTGRAMVCVSL